MSDFPVMQEEDTLAARKVTGVALAALVVLGVSLVVAALLLRAGAGAVVIDTNAPGHPQAAASDHVGEVKQRPIEKKAWGEELRARQLDALRSYRYLDRDAGSVQIPIDRAIDLVVERSR